MDAVGKLLGLQTKASKSVSFEQTLCILGAILCFVPRSLHIEVAVDPAKATKWASILAQIVATRCCSQRTATKMAGRLSFAVYASTGKVGRAYLKPLYAQANAPLPRGRASPYLLQAAMWWIQYLVLCPSTTVPCLSSTRPTVHAWTDAAGASR